MPRILFVINSLSDGGAERVLINVLSRAPAGWKADVALLDTKPERRSVPDGVCVHRLNARDRLLASVHRLRGIIGDLAPDLVVSFLVRSNVASVLASRSLSVPCIISERAHLSTHLRARYRGLQRSLAKSLIISTYGYAHHAISVSEGVRHDLINEFGVTPNRVQTIPNPYDLDFIADQASRQADVTLPAEFIASVGRMTPSKGFDDLIAAYAMLSPPEHLCIIGDGEDLPQLTQLASNLGVSRKVHFLGYLTNPFAVVARARCYVSASKCEGFPNALAEAMALGVPAIAADCPSGPAELLNETLHGLCHTVIEGKYGLLTPVSSPAHLAEAMARMTNNQLANRYAVAGRKRMASFHIDAVAENYWSRFATTLEELRDSDIEPRGGLTARNNGP